MTLALALFFGLVGLLAPGYAILGWTGRGLPRDVRTALACGTSVFVLGVAVWLAYLFHWPHAPVVRTVLGLSLGAALATAWLRRPRLDWPLLGVTALVALHAACFHLLLPVYCGGGWFGDWSLHHQTTFVYLQHAPADTDLGGLYTLFSRMPLFNLWLAGLLASSGADSFPVYQAGAAALSALAVLGLVLVARRLVPGRLADLAWVFALFIPVVFKNTAYPWPKFLASFYLLAALALVLEPRRKEVRSDPALVGLLCAMGYWAHHLALIYTLLLLVWTWRDRGRKAALQLALVAALALLPWYAWGLRTFGPDAVWSENPAVIRSEKTGPAGWVGYKTLNAVHTLLPVRLFRRVATEPYAGDYAVGIMDGIWAYEYGTLPGNIGLALLVALVLGARSPALRSPPARRCLVWVAAGFAGGILLHPLRLEDNGLAQVTMQPAALVLAALAIAALARMERIVAAAVLFGLAFEHVLLAWNNALLLRWGADVPMSLANRQVGQLLELRFLAQDAPALADAFLWAAVALELGVLAFGIRQLAGRPEPASMPDPTGAALP